ncbi:MAG: P1 family peptidase [Lachnospiraceae bacterium]|nr:P1 family peptidase [Lachnospiraceae bacterium]
MSCRRIRDYGIKIGSFPVGDRNSIGDIPGVAVGHCTIDTASHKTGVTVILPRKENIFSGKLIAASDVLNGFGKTAGTIQINELGTLESPIALTNTLNVGLVHDALVGYMADRCREEGIPLFSFNPVVGECNDCHLNDIKERAVDASHVLSAIHSASADFEQGDVGAGKGTICYGLKGGIGSASRKMEIGGKTYHIGVLVQSNFGKMEDLTIQGMEMGRTIRKWQDEEKKACPKADDEGSIMSIIATDLPLSSRQIRRILKRAAIGLGRTGSHVGHGSGDVMIGFSTANIISGTSDESFSSLQILNESLMDIPFRAVIEAEEEAVLNSLAAADSVTGYTGETCHALDPYLKRFLTLYRTEK